MGSIHFSPARRQFLGTFAVGKTVPLRQQSSGRRNQRERSSCFQGPRKRVMSILSADAGAGIPRRPSGRWGAGRGYCAFLAKTYTDDRLNRVIASTDPLNQTVTLTYDAAGDTLARQDPLAQTITYTYDALHHLVGTTDPLNHTVTSVWDAVGSVVASNDALGNTAINSVNSLQQLPLTVDAGGGLTSDGVWTTRGRFSPNVPCTGGSPPGSACRSRAFSSRRCRTPAAFSPGSSAAAGPAGAAWRR